jgi:predicted RNase H-like nuclease (RuvC/YqgF family)
MTAKPVGKDDAAVAQALVDLSAGVLPVWARHLATSRAQSEVAVTEMLQAFADIDPHINMAERQSQQITEALSQADNGITGLATACERALSPLLQNAQLPAGGAEAINQVLGMVRSAVQALEEIAKPFTHETQMVAAQVERMYVGFQYQDRISQMMALLEGDIARLREALDNKNSTPPALAEWLASLESNYAMAEQRHDHQGAGAQSATDNNETTFF